MPRGPVVLVCFILTSLVGCGVLEGRLLHTRLPAWEQQDDSPPALPVGLHDVTDLVIEIEAGEPAAVDGPPWIKVTSIDGQPDALKVDWMGGACITSIHVELGQEGETFVLALDEEKSLGGMVGCPAVGVLRSVILRLSRPMAPENVRLDYALG